MNLKYNNSVVVVTTLVESDKNKILTFFWLDLQIFKIINTFIYLFKNILY